ncbi:hypothetical protein GCM10012287_46330 [Streptomyces daqingensis]|uniref:Uncharacterized protein n=1 Tax=Streptomyces daqingensis TaxID=1472640 RepID=A0ABQ2MP47_9ACTN|nr:hypothetical protein [Streptomyces daqingensis]GGO55319.1 hypothetical protein GCM10012287_46330 [Streptomyces daqingensis]
MTDTTMKPVEAPEAAPATDPPPQPPDTTPASDTTVVEHTPGGWPVVPLALTGTNATASLLGSAALVGGPAALAVAATGAAVLGTAAATRARRNRTKTQARTGTNSQARKGAGGRVPRQRSASTLGTSGRKPGGSRGKAAGGLGKSSRSSVGSGRSRGRVGQVKALRDAQRKNAPSRAQRRTATNAARRSAADARRDAKSRARNASLAGRGPIGRGLGKGLRGAGKACSAAVDKARKERDRRNAGKVADQRANVRKAPAKKRARRALWRSAARFQGRCLVAALLASALGVVGLVTTPLGRKLGWRWLQYPGRRLYWSLTDSARQQRDERDEQIRADQADEEAAADAEAADDGSDDIGEKAERPAGLVPATPEPHTTEGEHVSGFRFEDYAAEMESAANSYDPENAMEILAMVEGIPAALTSVANVMKILAERADHEFPLEKQVADGFNDIFGAVMSAVAVAEDMGPLFRTAHEQDIARHEDPRNGTDAEKGWNV